MSKRAIRKDFYMEIVKSLGRFLSIFFIVALGVAFFAGIRSAEPDMRLSGDAYFDRLKLADLKVVSTMGLTEEDLEELAKVDGVEKAEGGYSTDVLCNIDDSQKVLHLMSALPTMNEIEVTEGRMPEKEGECLVDQDFMESSAYEIGDKIQVKTDSDSEIEDTLTGDTLTIVGAGTSPCYIAFGRGSSTIGTGDVSGFLVTVPETFSLEVYTEANILVEGAAEETAFTPEYDELIEKIQDRVEDISDARCIARRQGIMADAQEEVDKAKKELADAKEEADTKLEEARVKIEDGEKKLADAKQEVADGQAQLADGKSTIAEKEQELNDAIAQYNDGTARLQQGKDEYNAGLEEYNVNEAEAKAQLDAAYEQIQQSRAEMDSQWTQYEDGMAQIRQFQEGFEQLQAGITEVEAGIAQIETMLQNPELPDEAVQQAQMQKQGLQQQLEELNQQKAGMEEQRAGIEEQTAVLAAAKEQLDAAEGQYEAGVQEYNAQYDAVYAALEEAKNQLDAAAVQIQESETQLADAWAQISDGQNQIAEAKNEISENERKLADARQKIAESEQELADGRSEYESKKAEADEEIAKNEKKIADAEEEIKDIGEPKWYVQDRSSLPEYSGYGDNADRMRAIGRVFPVLFFLVAALISLTSMTRMVEEQRTQIGTLKALGYSKLSIASKYINYALVASVGGSIVGVLVGEKILPYIIVYSYKIMYMHMPEIVIPYNMQYAVMATAAAVACTLAATVFSCYKELASVPAELMRPPAPKQGKRVLMERITFIWKHLSFIWKSTIRNLVRYKKRFFMTVFGIGGCMALMIVGFGLRDSIFEIARLQYGDIQKNDGTAYLEEDLTEQNYEDLDQYFSSDSKIKSYTESLTKKIDVSHGKETQELYLFVPKDSKEITQFISFRDRTTQKTQNLTEEGVILTEKTAKTLGVKKGDKITIRVQGEKKEIKVTDITENYMGHYLYMTSAFYENIYGQNPEYNSILFKIRNFSDKRLLEAGKGMLAQEGVLNVTYTNNLEDRLNDMLKSLDLVIVVLIVSAGMLAFVVLYNLNNINITERKRELATIKVLGFYDLEVAEYVYRENVLLTLIGAAAGIVMGIILHRFVIVTVEIEEVMFGRNINLISFVFSTVLTIGFSAFVNWVMYFKLKKINMVESLKSVE